MPNFDYWFVETLRNFLYLYPHIEPRVEKRGNPEMNPKC